MEASTVSDQSPFVAAYDELQRLGYHCIPLMERSKKPGEYSKSRGWWERSGWQAYRDRAPTIWELRAWLNYSCANIGVMLGTIHDGWQLVAVDFDAKDPDLLDAMVRCVPVSPMQKRGAKGLTAFYLAPPGLLRNRQARIGGVAVLDILVGDQGKQTVMPPSIHPDGPTYVYLTGPVAPSELPHLTEDHIDQLFDTVAQYGGLEAALRTPASSETIDTDNPFADLNAAALADMAAWVPHLDLYGLTAHPNGYVSVASFRASGSGKPLERRGRNLGIHRAGIRDFAADRGYSALDLVMECLGMSLDAAYSWLEDRLGRTAALPLLEMPAGKISAAVELKPPVPAPALSPTPVGPLAAPPNDPLLIPGLVGEITRWITTTAIKPQPALSLAAALTIVGTLIGRRTATPYRDGATNLYVVGLAPTGGNKEHPLKAISILLTEAGFPSLIGASDYSAASAIAQRLEQCPLLLSPMDEFGAFCATVLSKKAGVFQRAISKTLRELWGNNFTPHQTSQMATKQAATIHAPNFSIYGVTNAKEFWDSLAGSDINNGLLNRFLLVDNKERPKSQVPTGSRLTPPIELLDLIREICPAMQFTSAVGPRAIPRALAWGEDAEATFHEFRIAMEIRGEENEEEQDFLQRTAEMALRIGTIIAAGRKSATVEVDDFEIGKSLALQSVEDMIRGAREHMSETEHQANLKMVLAVIRDAGMVSRSALYRKIDGKLDARAMDSILKMLVESEQIKEFAIAGSKPKVGRPKTAYEFLR